MPPKESKDLWFKNKDYGWGWVPVNGKGWSVIAFFVLVQLYPAYLLAKERISVAAFLVDNAIAVTVLLAICFWKGEKPEWRWGKK